MASVAYGAEAIVLVPAAGGAHGLGYTLPVTAPEAGLANDMLLFLAGPLDGGDPLSAQQGNRRTSSGRCQMFRRCADVSASSSGDGGTARTGQCAWARQ
ncbi:hypothetical protein EDD90_8807 [Streptomyces sp. Ag109_O5-1]|nr:hypothetical protein EDD90_8807 [Streptomyces sp. Ag109_O5-1]